MSYILLGIEKFSNPKLKRCIHGWPVEGLLSNIGIHLVNDTKLFNFTQCSWNNQKRHHQKKWILLSEHCLCGQLPFEFLLWKADAWLDTSYLGADWLYLLLVLYSRFCPVLSKGVNRNVATNDGCALVFAIWDKSLTIFIRSWLSFTQERLLFSASWPI